MTCEPTHSATSSPASAVGNSRCALQAGPPTGPCGPDRARASPSARPAKGKANRTRATCGPSCDASSRSADLQSCLESRLQALVDVDGSPEYVMTWKHWDMPLGAPICRLAASASRRSDSACSGWPTPNATDTKGASTRAPGKERRPSDFDLPTMVRLAAWPTPTGQDNAQAAGQYGRKEGTTLGGAARLVGWPAPAAMDGARGAESRETKLARGAGGINLAQACRLTGCSTPCAHDTGTRRTKYAQGGTPLDAQALGLILKSSTARMASGVALSPAHSRWLMGFPEAWDRAAPKASDYDYWQRRQTERAACEATEMPSPRKRRRSS